MDIDAIDPGVDFAQRIRQALTICRVALVVIGPRWISAAAPDGARRLDDPEDYLRMEIAAALRRDDVVVVVPVLVAGADMPTREQLPEPLQPLALRHAFELSDSRWVSDVGHLVDVVRRAVQRPDRPPSRAGIPSTILAIALILAIAGGGWLIWTAANPTGQAPDDGSGGDPPAPTESAQAPSPGPTVTPTSTVTPPPSDTDRIAYVSDREGVRDLWIMEADGSDPHPVLDNDARRAVEAAGGIGHPDWTDDGRIVFSSTMDLGRNEDQDQEIWVVNEDGTGLEQLTFNAEEDATPDWSPDGERIAYSRGPDAGGRDIWVMNSDGSGNTNLTASDEDDDTPDWSPDGGQIVWERAVATTTGEQHDIWRMDADGSNERAVTDTSEADDYWPAWAPNGRRIAFRSNVEGGGVAKPTTCSRSGSGAHLLEAAATTGSRPTA